MSKTIFGVGPYYDYSTMGPVLIIEASILCHPYRPL